MADANGQSLCAMCDEPSTQLCGGCKSIRYCSKACQKLDWRIHRLICKTYIDFFAGRPDREHHSMIYFPVGEPQPRFIWVHIDDGHNHPSLEELAKHNIAIDCSDTEGRFPVKSFRENFVLGRPLDPHYITIILPSTAQCCPCCKETHKSNDSLLKIDAELADTLRGPFLAWGVHHADYEAHKTSPVDLGPLDFRHMVDELRLHYEEVQENWRKCGTERPNYNGINGVRVNCEGDEQVLCRPSLENYNAPVSALGEESALLTPIADRLGMPLHISTVAPAPAWRDRRLKSRMHNCFSAYLNPFISMQDNIGSLIILRKDGGDLGPMMLRSFFILVASKLELDCTKTPVPVSRLAKFKKEDTQSWVAAMKDYEMVPDRLISAKEWPPNGEQDEDNEMEDA
ncbi:hypothetical protein C7974DRAFT_439480 [Boeremia exigua]|uniref:uncharacterized protein n=1 Tax=Boeremia exigua TaxID=749465 RepID=UPI001E8E57F8|nr:uncharacterized protein C7974DRAFT_439480 [Boeremia exigua]KAH6644218.1 hypothetical protein C7974DRAFT_439480 [Boeremia exigua]